MITIAPFFSKRAFPTYQRLGVTKAGLRSAPHRALETVLAEVAQATGGDTRRVFLFVFSGGAQFALLQGCGHSFTRCVRDGDMMRIALEFFLASTKRMPHLVETQETRDHLLFSTAVH